MIKVRSERWQGIILILLSSVLCLLLSSPSFSAQSVDITADVLEYDAKTNTYVAKGSARIVTEGTVLTGDEITLNRETSDAVAKGNVYYEDEETTIRAEMIELNLRTKLGTIYDSNILYRKNNYHLIGDKLKRLDEKSYHINSATVTTCDDIPPPWYISGRDVNAIKHKHLTARDTTFYVKGIPIFYTPYFWMPLTKKRQTGLLVPSIGSSTTKGFFYKQGFFWAIKDNMDLTFYGDYFSEKGIGKGLEYRYILTPDTFGNIWLYHLRDTDLDRDFLEVKSYHDFKISNDISGYLRINTVNTYDYYTIIGSTSLREPGFQSLRTINLKEIESSIFDVERSERLTKYLESDLYITRPFQTGRIYILGQYRQSLEDGSEAIPQSIPEVGFIYNTFSKGYVSMNISTRINNFLKEEEDGQRVDINPNIYLSYGRSINLTQRVSIRETAYHINKPSDYKERFQIDMTSTLSTRFLKNYPSFVHAIEPSIEYRYTPILNNTDIPVFDSIDSVDERSIITYSITNRFDGLMDSRLRLSQGYDLLKDDNPFTPILLEGGLSSGLADFNINASYNIYDSRINDIFTNIKIKHRIGYIGIGKNFHRLTDVDQYTLEAGVNSPISLLGSDIPLSIGGKIWYDMVNESIQESTLSAIYRKQCWALSASIVNRPEEYVVSFRIEFIGLGAIRW